MHISNNSLDSKSDNLKLFKLNDSVINVTYWAIYNRQEIQILAETLKQSIMYPFTTKINIKVAFHQEMTVNIGLKNSTLDSSVTKWSFIYFTTII